jgi:two-component system, NarL family, sensor histidine kinase DegS
VPTIKKYTQAFQEQNGIETTFTLSGNERRLQPYLEVLVFRAVQELLANAASQGRATQVKVHLDMAETHLRVNLDDNGRGFELGQIEKSGGMGLKMIQDRIALLEGTFQVDSIPGQGTRIHFQIPTAVAPQDGQAASEN